MIHTLITSQTRVKILKKFFFDSNIRAHLRGLEAEFKESTNSIRIELNRFEKAGLLKSSQEGNKKYYQVNNSHPLYLEIHNLVLKEYGYEKIVSVLTKACSKLKCIYLISNYMNKRTNSQTSLLLIGRGIKDSYLNTIFRNGDEELYKGVVFFHVEDIKDLIPFMRKNEYELFPLWVAGGD